VKRDWKAEIQRYGALGLAVWFSIFFLSIGVFWSLLRLGVRLPWLDGVGGDASTLLAAYLATKVLMVPRAILTLAVTPVLAKKLGKAPPS
jgi:apolipoprotein N-acyltransferase